MLDNLTCVLTTQYENINTKFILYDEDDTNPSFSLSLPGIFLDCGILNREEILKIGHDLSWFDETQSHQQLKISPHLSLTLESDFHESQTEISVDSYLIDIWLNFNNVSVCTGPFLPEQITKLGSFFLEYGLFGTTEEGRRCYGHPTDLAIEKALSNPMDNEEINEEITDYLNNMFEEEGEPGDEAQDAEIYQELEEVLDELWDEEISESEELEGLDELWDEENGV